MKELNSDMHNSMTTKNESEEINILYITIVLCKHRKLIISIILLSIFCVLFFTILSLVLPPKSSYLPNLYTPKAIILIQQGNSSSLSTALSASGLSSLAGIAGAGMVSSTNGQLAKVLATSNTLIDILNAKFDLTNRYKVKKSVVSDTRKAFLKHYTASFDEKTNIFTMSYEDIDPKFAKAVVDEAVSILSARFASLNSDKTLQQKELLEKKLIEVDNSVKELEIKVKEFQSKYGVTQVDALATEQITILARLRSELILKEMEISNYEKISRVEDPQMIQLKTERDALLAKIKEIETGKGSGSRVMPSQKELPTIAFEYAKIQRDLLVQTELFKLLTQQYELAKLNAAGQDPVFQVLEMAEVPDKKSGPSRGMICVVATMAGFFLSILLAFVVESFEKIKNDPEVVAKFKALSSKKGAAQ